MGFFEKFEYCWTLLWHRRCLHMWETRRIIEEPGAVVRFQACSRCGVPRKITKRYRAL